MRYSPTLSRIIVVALCLALLSACNGAAGNSGPRPTATFGPAVKTRLAEASRPRPTSTPLAEGQALAPTVPPATPTSLPTPAPTSTPEPDSSDELLLTALLAVEDLGESWWGDEAFTYDAGASTWNGDDGMLRTPGSNDACESDVSDPYLNQAARIYGEDQAEWLMVQFVALYEHEQSADLYLSQLIAQMQQCPEYEDTFAGQVETVRVSQLEYPALGDRSAAFVLVSTGSDYQAESMLVGLRVDRTVVVILHMGESAHAGPVETWGTQEIAVRAFEKIMSLREQFDMLERPAPSVV